MDMVGSFGWLVGQLVGQLVDGVCIRQHVPDRAKCHGTYFQVSSLRFGQSERYFRGLACESA